MDLSGSGNSIKRPRSATPTANGTYARIGWMDDFDGTSLVPTV